MTTGTQDGSTVLTKPTELAFQLERVFSGPRERVYRAFTDPTLIPQWWGMTTVVDEMDVRPGGSWQFHVETPSGHMVVMKGTYREVVPPERIVQTFENGWRPGKVHLETYTFEDLGEETRVTTLLVFDTTEDRDQLLAQGALKGTNETYARLDELLKRLPAG